MGWGGGGGEELTKTKQTSHMKPWTNKKRTETPWDGQQEKKTIVRKTGSVISTTLIQGFNFTNSRFQLHEFTNSTSRIHDFNFTNSRIQLHEFTNSTSRIHEFNFTNSRIPLHEFNFTNSTSRIHEFNFTNSISRIHS